MKVHDYSLETLKKRKLHMTVIDPAKQTPVESGEMAEKAKRVGTDAITVGGSTGVTQEDVDSTVDHIKKRCDLPVIHFPSGAKSAPGPGP